MPLVWCSDRLQGAQGLTAGLYQIHDRSCEGAAPGVDGQPSNAEVRWGLLCKEPAANLACFCPRQRRFELLDLIMRQANPLHLLQGLDFRRRRWRELALQQRQRSPCCSRYHSRSLSCSCLSCPRSGSPQPSHRCRAHGDARHALGVDRTGVSNYGGECAGQHEPRTHGVRANRSRVLIPGGVAQALGGRRSSGVREPIIMCVDAGSHPRNRKPLPLQVRDRQLAQPWAGDTNRQVPASGQIF